MDLEDGAGEADEGGVVRLELDGGEVEEVPVPALGQVPGQAVAPEGGRLLGVPVGSGLVKRKGKGERERTGGAGERGR